MLARHKIDLCRLFPLLVLLTQLSAQFGFSQSPINISRGVFGILNAGSQSGLTELPQSYLDYLSRLNTQWVAIGVTLHVDNSVDSTVERFYSTDYENYVPTFDDASIITMVQQLHSRGYKVLLSLALDEPWPDDGSVNPALPPGKAAWRYQIGDPITPAGYSLAEWPWNPSNTNHQSFIHSFWESYTREAIYYANICQQQGVEIFQVGAETEQLFRTRAIGTRTNNFRAQIQTLVDSTRAHYSGKVAYYMHAGTWQKAWHNADTLYHELWGDIGFDVIGGSVYGLALPKTTVAPNTLDYLKSQYRTVFTTYFRPVVLKYPTKPVAILELGIQTWNKSSVLGEPDGSVLMNREDLNHNGIIDAEEVQAIMFDAYYAMADSLGYPQPGFIFGDEASSDALSHLGSAYQSWGIRQREAELHILRRFRNIAFTSVQNSAPRLLTRSDSNYVAVIGQNFESKQFIAVDDDTVSGDVVMYRTLWANYPWFGAAPSRGTVVGLPQDDDAGWWQAKLFAQDVYGRPSIDTANFILWTIHPRSPQVTSVPPTTMRPGQGVNYQVVVVDQSGVPITSGLTYSLLVNPFFLNINATGKVTGTPTFAVGGTTRAAEVKIVKTTAPAATYYDSWTIDVINSNDPPTWGGDGKLLDPKNGVTYNASSSIPFRVGYCNDLNDDTLFFSFRIYGVGFDTTFIRKSSVISRAGSQKWDTTGIRFSLNLNGRVTLGQTYSWYVKVIDRKDTLVSDTWTFGIQSGGGAPQAILAIAPSTMAFGPVPKGQTKDSVVTVYNNGNDTLRISSVTSNQAAFSSRSSSFKIGPGKSRPDTIRFTPSAAGGFSALIFYASNDATTPDTVHVSGTGFVSASSSYSPKEIRFGNTKVGSKRDTALIILNTGSDTLKVSSVSSSRSLYVPRITSFKVLPGNSFVDTVRYEPTATAIDSGSLVITSNSLTSPDTIKIVGFGIAPGNSLAGVSPKILRIGTIKAGQAKDTTFAISNTGTDTLQILAVLSTQSVFSFRSLSMMIAPGKAIADTVRYSPKVPGLDSAFMIIHSTSPTSPDSIRIYGRSAGTPVAVFNPKVVQFGGVKIGQHRDTTYSVQNQGNDTLQITSFVSTNTAFTLKQKIVLIPPASSYTDTLHFTPSSAKVDSGIIFFTSNALGSSDTIRVYGSGISATNVDVHSLLPAEFRLDQNFPNPFNPATTIRYSLPVRSIVKLEIFTILGEMRQVLDEGTKNAGYYQIDWIPSVSSGLYFYRLEAVSTEGSENKFISVKKMMFLK